jgi:hypothetical protein
MDAAIPVLGDAQFTTTRLLRPHEDFVATYNGQNANIPIMFTEGGVERDPNAEAGVTGYDANLVAGAEVPLGSRVLLWFPMMTAPPLPGQPEPANGYTWALVWRLRNLFDYRQNRKPWHIPTQEVGPTNQVIIPASDHIITYVQAEPAAIDTRSRGNVHAQNVGAPFYNQWLRATGITLPLLSDGNQGVIAQGQAWQIGVNVNVSWPSFFPFMITALGDELLVFLFRARADGDDWAIQAGGVDELVYANLEDNPNNGVYLLSGTPAGETSMSQMAGP